MTAPRTHSPADLAAIERSSGMQLAGYLCTDAPHTLLPILARPGLTEAQRRALVARLNGRQVEPAPVEGRERRG